MATTPTPEDVAERVRRSQEQRIETEWELAESRQALTDQREAADRERAKLEARSKNKLREREAAEVEAYSKTTFAEWIFEELRKIGFPEPEKKRPARCRTNPSRRSTAGTLQADDGATPVTAQTPAN